MPVELSEDLQIDIFAAARAGDLDDLKQLVDDLNPLDLLKIVNEYTKATPLHYAAANGHEGKLLGAVYTYTSGVLTF